MLTRLNSFFEQEINKIPVEPILVGVSGGPDSICLLDLLIRSGRKVIVAHFNHKLRPASEFESVKIQELTKNYGVLSVCGSGDVRLYSSENKLSIEEAARLLRYDFLFRQANELGAPVIAVAHHADDQVETILMHFLRGSGLSGLKGMLPVTRLPQFDPEIWLIRPLLRVWRIEIEQYCSENGLDPIQDESNQDQTYFRNRLRHQLIPELETYNPGVKKVLLRSSENLAGDFALVNEVVDKTWEVLDVKFGENFISFSPNCFRKTSKGIQRNIIRKAAGLLKPELRDVSFEIVERTIKFFMDEQINNKKMDFSDGIIASQDSRRLTLSNGLIYSPVYDYPQTFQEKEINFEVPLLLEGSWVVIAEEVSIFDIESIRSNGDPYQTWLDADKVKGLISVRGREKGDRFQPLGMNVGSIKVSDLFINEKIPFRARKHWPLFSLENEIVWIPGARSAHRCRVTEKTTKSIHFKVMNLTRNVDPG